VIEKDDVWVRVPQALNLPIAALVIMGGIFCSVWVWLATQVRRMSARFFKRGIVKWIQIVHIYI
jgi:hypothetical protein